MTSRELRSLIREEIIKTLNEASFKAFGGVHTDDQLDALEDELKIYKSKDPKVWDKYIESLKKLGYDKPSHKEHPSYKWAVKKRAALK